MTAEHVIETVAMLTEQLGKIEQARRPVPGASVPSGIEPLDRLLPEGGWRRGALVEWLSAGNGTGAGTLALQAAREACREGGALVVIDARGEFYPPAAAAQGVNLRQTIVVRPTTGEQGLWAWDQSLRCCGVGAVLGWVGGLDGRVFRRWQLAAEAGGVLGLLLRPATLRPDPSWAEIRLLITSRERERAPEPLPPSRALKKGDWLRAGHVFSNVGPPREVPVPLFQCPAKGRLLRLHLLRCPGGLDGKVLELEIDDETGLVHLAAELADPTPLRRSAGA